MFERRIAQIAERLDRVHLPYMVIGGQAVLAYGEPRLSRTIDIAVELRSTRLDELLAALDGLDLEWPEDVHEFARETDVVPCRQRGSGIRVGFVLANSEFEHEALARTHSRELASRPIRFVGPEDLIVLKLLAGRPLDHEDVRGILLKHPDLDRDLIRTWLRRYEAALGRPLVATFEELVRTARGD